jgi:hypothetical protein
MQLIKTLERRPWGERPQRYDTWYEPFDEPGPVDLAIHYALSQPGMFINTAGDINLLPLILDAANRYPGAPSEAAMEELVREQGAEPLWAA